ncbi:MAG TPA: alcohol dehydrogenase catalytic domain-containing protein, partial [Haliangium sp.]|nr:alcohol dehydrogenase catalytic domain-containing protein [Haliangium sp.]
MPTARAVKIRGAGGVDVLHIEDVEIRAPGPHEVLVEVAAAGLNRADTLQRRGMYPAPPGAPPDVPGLEYAGTVAEIGAGVTATRVGARVMGIVGGGGMATHVVVHERELVPVPRDIDLVHAAAIPEVFFTAYDALFRQGRLAMGEIVLVHAVGSGVGTAAAQLVYLAGARVIGTSRTRDKLDRC